MHPRVRSVPPPSFAVLLRPCAPADGPAEGDGRGAESRIGPVRARGIDPDPSEWDFDPSTAPVVDPLAKGRIVYRREAS